MKQFVFVFSLMLCTAFCFQVHAQSAEPIEGNKGKSILKINLLNFGLLTPTLHYECFYVEQKSIQFKLGFAAQPYIIQITGPIIGVDHRWYIGQRSRYFVAAYGQFHYFRYDLDSSTAFNHAALSGGLYFGFRTGKGKRRVFFEPSFGVNYTTTNVKPLTAEARRLSVPGIIDTQFPITNYGIGLKISLLLGIRLGPKS